MAAVRTPHYWFAFHIGDGKLYCCDKLMQWREPIPWDCNCMFNVTTSLCQSQPVKSFRYAFDGTGNFPIAFALGSDGIDGTFLQDEYIHNFYSQVLCACNVSTENEVVELLNKRLPDYSRQGSHDDMSVAAIVDKDELPLAVKYYKAISKIQALTGERTKRSEALSASRKKAQAAREEADGEFDKFNGFANEFRSFLFSVISKFQEKLTSFEDKQGSASNSRAKLKQLQDDLAKEEQSFAKWCENAKSRVVELQQQAEQIKKEIETASCPEPSVHVAPENEYSEQEMNADSDAQASELMKITSITK